ncbi:C40 family peptidase [Limosilactobacillus urinaemulieris]|uniref:C40 family peptidase n=1 Tax=Limosilactobacillus urinaemulieris TaxID=2742600 RepID=UPI001F562331|nr:C40 family peptidase [Limosilactobacillus urinaemulieris]
MVKKVRKYSSSTRLVAGTLGALSVFALTTQANNTVEAKAKSSNHAEQPASMSSSANAVRNSGQLSLAPIQSSSASSKSASAAKNGIYVVKSGDTLSELAVQFNVSLNDLVAWNHIQNPDLIYVGQQLSINGENVNSAVAQSSTAPVAQPQSFTVTGNVQQSQPQVVQGAVSGAAQPQAMGNTVQQAVNQQGQSSQMVGSAYTSTVNAAAYNSAAPSQQSSAVAVADDQQVNSQQPVSANSTQAVAYSTASRAAATNQTAVQSQQVATSSAASQPTQQSQVQQSQVAQQATSQQAPSQTNANLQSGSVVSLASKIASSNSVPYQWGGNSLSGMDCSGFVQYVYANAEGKQLPHNTVAMESYVNTKPVNQAQSGDLLFWGNQGSSYHVGIYMGNNQYAAAAKPGTNVAVYNLSSYFKPSFAGTVK